MATILELIPHSVGPLLTLYVHTIIFRGYISYNMLFKFLIIELILYLCHMFLR